MRGGPMPPAEDREQYFREKAYLQVLEHLRRVLHSMGVDFDVWFSERTLHECGADGGPSPIECGIETLRDAGYVYEEEGAIWFRSTDFGDDKDRVLKKADGSYTYFAADIAYHADKFDRGLRRGHRSVGRGPPRLRQAHGGRRGRAWATRASSRSSSASS